MQTWPFLLNDITVFIGFALLTALDYRYLKKDGAVYEILGEGVTFARASAGCIKLNCALLLVSVLRNFLSW